MTNGIILASSPPRSNPPFPFYRGADLPPPCYPTISELIPWIVQESPLDKRPSVFQVQEYRRQVPFGKNRCSLSVPKGLGVSPSPPHFGEPHRPFPLPSKDRRWPSLQRPWSSSEREISIPLLFHLLQIIFRSNLHLTLKLTSQDRVIRDLK